MSNMFGNLFGGPTTEELEDELQGLLRKLGGKTEIKDIAKNYHVAQTTCPSCSKVFKLRFPKGKGSAVQVKCPGCSKTLRLKVPQGSK